MNCNDIQALVSLFEEQHANNKLQTEISEPGFQAEIKTGSELRDRSGDIWDADQVSDDPLMLADCNDGRLEPKYDMKLGQTLSAEDTYFGLSGKDLSSRSCDQLNITIELPNETLEQIDLDVNAHRLVLRSPKYKLFLHLPYKVDDDNGNATWNKPFLKVTLPIV